jgi:hypothetical protein
MGTSLAFRSLASCMKPAISSRVSTGRCHAEPAPRGLPAWLVLLVASLSLGSQAWSQACTNLCLKQTSCPGNGTTSISGTVYAPNGVDPLPNVLVYVPNGTVQPFASGVACEQSGAPVTGEPLVSTTTATDGTFTLTNMPVGMNIPLVIQAGRWRRQVVIPTVTGCVNTAVAASLTNLPTSSAQGDIPHIAVVTGEEDATECLLRRVGIADSEFTIASGMGRVNLFEGNGATLPGITAESTLVATLAELKRYDMVMFGCQGTPDDDATAENQQNLIGYANAGGRVAANHYEYVWLYNDAPFSGTADWDVGQTAPPSPVTTTINQSFPKGAQLAAWLYEIGASTSLGQIPEVNGRYDFNGVVSPSESWLQWEDGETAVPMQYTFNTPIGDSAATQCGRVLYYDYHVESATTDTVTFPAECSSNPMTAQEKLAEFALFDLTAPVSPDVPPSITLGFTNTPPTFGQGDSADDVAINITNTSSTTSTNPSLTATFTVSAGLTAETLSGTNAGTGWTCTLGTLTCTRTNGLSASTSDPITLVVSVASNAATGSGSSVSATIAGGGLFANVTGSDPITITSPPTVTVTPGQSSINTAQALSVTVTVSGGSGNPTPTGSVKLSSGSYTSAATTLTTGSATINIPAGSLAVGSDTLTATYTPDSGSSSTYASATGTAPVTVSQAIGSCTTANPNPNPNPESFAAAGDFNGDCRSDILWHNTSTEQVYEWLMNGTTFTGSGSPGSLTSDWVIQDVGDFNADGKADILWRNSTTGEVVIWLMNGTTMTSSTSLGNVSSDWSIAGVGDFNGDGYADILWQNTSGEIYLWLMNGTTIAGGGIVGNASSGWNVAGIGDFNADGMADILWRNSTTGQVYIWLMNGTTIASTGTPGSPTSDWSIAGVGDFDGNGTSDILWRNSTTGEAYLWFMSGTTFPSSGSVSYVSSDWVIRGVGDYDGSGRAGILWRNSTTEQVYVWLMNGTTLTSSGSPGTPDATWQIQP